jgi:hypothetical protein
MREQGVIEMKRLAPPRLATQSERIGALEEGRKADGARLGSIETKVNEMHEILLALRTIGRFLKIVMTYVGGPSAVGTGALYAWKLFSGH